MSGPLRIQTANKQLTVEFTWHVDRYVHRIISDAGCELTSVDGTPEDLWPSSPPIQQLSLESIDGQSVLLGVGAAGSGHWSISVSSVVDGEYDALKFELACRSREVPDRLASTYRHGASGSIDSQLHVEARSGIAELTTAAEEVLLAVALSGDERTRQWSYLDRETIDS